MQLASVNKNSGQTNTAGRLRLRSVSVIVLDCRCQVYAVDLTKIERMLQF